MYLSSLTAIGIWLLYSDKVMDFYGFVFNMIFISGWNAIEIATIESYPTHLRYVLTGLMVSDKSIPIKSIYRKVFSAGYFNITHLMYAHFNLIMNYQYSCVH
jgi:hypothetical protein